MEVEFTAQLCRLDFTGRTVLLFWILNCYQHRSVCRWKFSARVVTVQGTEVSNAK